MSAGRTGARRRLLNKLIFTCGVLILMLVILYSGLRILESTLLSQPVEQLQTETKTITRDGVRYYPRKDITIMMILGVNREGKVQATEFNRGGAVDMVTLMIFDQQREAYDLLILNRDMMLDMPVLNEYGAETGLYYGQLAYSHTFGDGMEASCENVRKTVSNLLSGITVDYYFALSMDAIGILNDAVGGVTVEVKDDFSSVGGLPMGQVKLNSKQAVRFVQSRMGVSDELNLSRMDRHKEYMRGFLKEMNRKMDESSGFVVKAYEQVADYVVTDCSAQILSRLETDYGDYSFGEALFLEGENVLGAEFYEYYVDEEALEAFIIDHFYAPRG